MIESIIGLIGNLVLPFTVLSLFTILITEFVAQVAQLRARTLEACIKRMLRDGDGAGLGSAVYRHPLIESLSLPNRRLSYMPPRLFALALADCLTTAANTSDISSAVERVPDPELRRILTIVTRDRQRGPVQAFERWFNEVMDQASGLYRWRSFLVVAGVATTLVVLLNFDAIRITNRTANREIIERLIEARVAALASDTTLSIGSLTALPASTSLLELQALAFPIGWLPEIESWSAPGTTPPLNANWLLTKILGLLTSIFAVMLGAPFLFDLLNRLTIVRFTMKPFEPGPEEQWEDRPWPAVSAAPVSPRVPPDQTEL